MPVIAGGYAVGEVEKSMHMLDAPMLSERLGLPSSAKGSLGLGESHDNGSEMPRSGP